jgi:hypothetical protein
MCSSSREEIVEVFDALKADFKRALDLSFDVLTTPERLALLQSCEGFHRCLPALEPDHNQPGTTSSTTSPKLSIRSDAGCSTNGSSVRG